VTQRPWWGATRVPLGSARRWRIGPLTLRVTRGEGEWRVERSVGDDPLEDALELAMEDDPHAEMATTQTGERPSVTTVDRFGFAGDDDELTLEPALADRAIVSRPDSSFRLPGGERITLFVGTPLWLRLSVAGRLLADVPIYRPSDSWFGQTTMEGEICYASRTVCRARLGETISRPHRALSAVQIENLADEPLPLERVKLPVPYLALYTATDGRLWTQDVVFERHVDGADRARLEKHVPRHAEGAKRLAEPRIDDSNLMKRAFGSLFTAVTSR
jgi:hypothetical protein